MSRGENLRELMAAIKAGEREDWRRRPRPESRGFRPVGYCRWRGRIPIPKHAHPLVRRLYQMLNEQQTTLAEATKRAGLTRGRIGHWAHKATPRLDEFEAALGAIGYRLTIEAEE